MVSTTSGTTTFSLDVDDIIEQALEPVGGDFTNANDQSKARRSLNLILIELQNKNIPLDKLEVVSVELVSGQADYTFSDSVSDVLEATLKDTTSQTDFILDRWGRQQFHQVPNKSEGGRPTLFVTDRSREGVRTTLWPIPNKNDTWTFEALVTKRIEDITASYQKIDLPYRYFPLLVAWLSYKLSLVKPGIDPILRQTLKGELDVIMMDTFEEDKERVDMFIVPGGISGK